ncbi:MAG: glycosyltransferase family 4 protein [Acidimicrobiales bacterium]
MTTGGPRVSFDASAVPAEPRGAGRYVSELAGALASGGEVDLVVLCGVGDAARWRAWAPGATVVDRAPRRRPGRLAWEQLRMPSVLAELGVHLHHGPHYTMPERARVPCVVTVHDLTFVDHPDWHERLKVPVFRRAIRVAAARADAIVCVSQATAARLQDLCHPRAPVHVVPHGVDHRRFRPAAAPAGDGSPALGQGDLDWLRRLGVRPPYVAFVGTIEPRKGLPTLVAAFDRVAPRHPGLSLVLAGGGGWGEAPLDAAIARSPFSERIRRTGYVADDAIPALLRQAAVVACPALEEGFGLPALEALACGAPLVTTSGSAMAEVVGDAAWLVAPGDAGGLADALEDALAGGPLVERRRREGLDRAAAATWQACASAHAAVYRSVL